MATKKAVKKSSAKKATKKVAAKKNSSISLSKEEKILAEGLPPKAGSTTTRRQGEI